MPLLSFLARKGQKKVALMKKEDALQANKEGRKSN